MTSEIRSALANGLTLTVAVISLAFAIPEILGGHFDHAALPLAVFAVSLLAILGQALVAHVKAHATTSVLCGCVACLAWGCWEMLQGHVHHAIPAFAAALPGAQAARMKFLAHVKEGA